MKKFFSILLAISLFVGLLTGCSGGKKVIVPTQVQLERNGTTYEVRAVQGQVWLLFNPYVAQTEAEKILSDNGARILEKRPQTGYYLVEVKAGTEGEFTSAMKKYREVDYVYPNALHGAKSAKGYVFDCFQIDHGKMVTQMFEEAALTSVTKVPLGLEFSDDEVNSELTKCLAAIEPGNSAVINMSFGVDLDNFVWTMSSTPVRNMFKYAYEDELIGLVKYTRNHFKVYGGEDDFVITKASGNEGVDRLEKFISEINDSLSVEEQDFFEKHFLLVSAKDDYRDWDYPNDVSNGGYHKMVSKVDISDKTISQDTIWNGTSFSSPRLAGYIVRAANEHDLKATEVLQHVRNVTEYAYNHVIDYEMLDEDIDNGSRDFSFEDDIVGLTLRAPENHDIFPSSWSWTIEEDEVLGVTELSRKGSGKGAVDVTVLAHLRNGKLKVDVEMVLTYHIYPRRSSIYALRVNDIAFPPQPNYASYTEVTNTGGEFNNVILNNYSDRDLFVVGEYYLQGRDDAHHFAVSVTSNGTYTLCSQFWRLPDVTSYNIRFAYEK